MGGVRMTTEGVALVVVIVFVGLVLLDVWRKGP